MREQNNNANGRLHITVSRLGGETQEFDVRDGTTVKEILNCAGIDLQAGETVHCNGLEAPLENLVDDNDAIQVIGSKDGGTDDAKPAEKKSTDEDDDEDDENDDKDSD